MCNIARVLNKERRVDESKLQFTRTGLSSFAYRLSSHIQCNDCQVPSCDADAHADAATTSGLPVVIALGQTVSRTARLLPALHARPQCSWCVSSVCHNVWPSSRFPTNIHLPTRRAAGLAQVARANPTPHSTQHICWCQKSKAQTPICHNLATAHQLCTNTDTNTNTNRTIPVMVACMGLSLRHFSASDPLFRTLITLAPINPSSRLC